MTPRTDAPWDVPHLIAAVNALNASRLTIFLAKLFGVRMEVRDGTTKVVTHLWRGKVYMTDYRP